MEGNYFGIRQDPAFQSQIRLAIVAALIGNPVLDFKTLKAVTGATDGNLSTHTQKLEELSYIKIDKTFKGRKPKTSYSLTQKGKESFIKYVQSLENVLKNI